MEKVLNWLLSTISKEDFLLYLLTPALSSVCEGSFKAELGIVLHNRKASVELGP